jgi:hypothetical protein
MRARVASEGGRQVTVTLSREASIKLDKVRRAGETISAAIVRLIMGAK